MKGLELSKAYFEEACLPILKERLPEYLGRIAAGLVGEGSECFGYDDGISRDHSWGPRVCLWLTSEDFALFGESLSSAVSAFPASFEGFPVPAFDPREGKRSGIFTIEEFYTARTGLPRAPQTAQEWLSVPQAKLACAVNGEVFADPVGDFTRVRNELLAYYPEEVRRYLLATHAAHCAQCGQYNLIRSRARSHVISSAVMKAYFAEHITAMFFLLCRRYMPYYKWAYRALQDLPGGAALCDSLAAFLLCEDPRREYQMADEIAGSIICRLKEQQLSDADSIFLMDHCPALLSGISDPWLQRRPVEL